MQEIVEQIADLERDDHVRITVADETVIAGRVSPLEYAPDDHLRFEVRSDDERFEIAATYENGEWTPVRASRISGDEETWSSLGEVTSVDVEYQDGHTDHQGDQSGARL